MIQIYFKSNNIIKLITDSKLTKKRLKEELDEATVEFHKQSNSLNERIDKRRALESEWKVKLRNYMKKQEERGGVDALQERLALVKSRYVKLRQRHILEMEGYENEINNLKDKLRKLEKIYKSC